MKHQEAVVPLVWFIGHIVAVICLFIALFLKHNRQQDLFDYIIIAVLLFVLSEEITKNKNGLFHENFTETGARTRVVLITSPSCESCKECMKRGVWDDLKNYFKASSKYTFQQYDMSEDEQDIKAFLGSNITKLNNVPSIFFETQENVFKYNEDVYDLKHMIEILQQLN